MAITHYSHAVAVNEMTHRARDQEDTSTAMALLAILIAKLETAAPKETLRALVRDCSSAFEQCIEVRRDEEREPAMPTSGEVGLLAKLLMIVDPQESVAVMRQIRQVLGRIDAHTR